jgi:hypothetical protein
MIIKSINDFDSIFFFSGFPYQIGNDLFIIGEAETRKKIIDRLHK